MPMIRVRPLDWQTIHDHGWKHKNFSRTLSDAITAGPGLTGRLHSDDGGPGQFGPSHASWGFPEAEANAMADNNLVEHIGLEPMTSCLQSRRSSQLS
jgi:hypothetical protein